LRLSRKENFLASYATRLYVKFNFLLRENRGSYKENIRSQFCILRLSRSLFATNDLFSECPSGGGGDISPTDSRRAQRTHRTVRTWRMDGGDHWRR